MESEEEVLHMSSDGEYEQGRDHTASRVEDRAAHSIAQEMLEAGGSVTPIRHSVAHYSTPPLAPPSCPRPSLSLPLPLPLPALQPPRTPPQPTVDNFHSQPQRKHDLFDPTPSTSSAPTLPLPQPRPPPQQKKKFTPLAPIKRPLVPLSKPQLQHKSQAQASSAPKENQQPEAGPSQKKRKVVKWSQPVDDVGEGGPLKSKESEGAEESASKSAPMKRAAPPLEGEPAAAEEGDEGGENTRKKSKGKGKSKKRKVQPQPEQADGEQEESMASTSASGSAVTGPSSQAQSQVSTSTTQLSTTLPSIGTLFPTRLSLLTAVSFASHHSGHSCKILKYPDNHSPILKVGCPLHLPATNPNRCPANMNVLKREEGWEVKTCKMEHNHPGKGEGERGEWKAPVERKMKGAAGGGGGGGGKTRARKNKGETNDKSKGKGKSKIKSEETVFSGGAQDDSPGPLSPPSQTQPQPPPQPSSKKRPLPPLQFIPPAPAPIANIFRPSPHPVEHHSTSLNLSSLDDPLSQMFGSSTTSAQVELGAVQGGEMEMETDWREGSQQRDLAVGPSSTHSQPPQFQFQFDLGRLPPLPGPLPGPHPSSFRDPRSRPDPSSSNVARQPSYLRSPFGHSQQVQPPPQLQQFLQQPLAESPSFGGCGGGLEGGGLEGEPSQAEMDAFFGFRAPLPVDAPLLPAPLSVPPATDGGREVGREVLAPIVPPFAELSQPRASGGSCLKEKGKGKGREKEVTSAPKPKLQRKKGEKEARRLESIVEEESSVVGEEEKEVGEEDIKLAEQGKEQPYQLEPIDSSLDAEGRRLAIIHSLERLAVSVLEQLVGSVVPSASATTRQGSKKGREKTKTRKKTVVIVLAKRGGESGPEQDQADTNVDRKTRRLVFPRASGGGKSSSPLRLGGRELAAFLKVVETVLEGLKSRTVSTKRDIFYRSVALFVKQSVVDAIVEDLAATLAVRRGELNVVAASKGLFAGAMKVFTNDGVVLEGGSQGALIPAEQMIDRVELEEVKWVLIVEKEAVFHSLCSPDFLSHPSLPNGVLITGKGYPDLSTRELVKRLSLSYPALPLLCLVDSDPHGLEILSTYKYGSSALSFDRANLAVESVEWLGVKGSEWDSSGVRRDELLQLTIGDRKKGLKMLKREWLPEEWKRELEYMLHLQRKAEIQVLLSSSSSPHASQSQSQSSAPSTSNSSRAPSRLVDYVVMKVLAAIA